jgi:hypothetical protein
VWVPWALLLCGILLLGLLWANPRCVADSFSSMFSGMERHYTDTSGLLAAGGSLVFSTLVPAMALCVCVYRGGPFLIGEWLLTVAAVGVLWALQALLRLYTAAVFSVGGWLRAGREYLVSLRLAVSLLLYVAVCVSVVLPVDGLPQWLFGIAVAVYVAALSLRLVRMFYRNPLSLLYISLYILTLEVLPIAALFFVAGRLMPMVAGMAACV